MKKSSVIKIVALLLLIIGTVWVIRENQAMPYQRVQGSVFGTTYSITYQYDKDLRKEIESVLKDVDNTLSPFNDKSVISSVNRNENPPLNEMFVNVYDLAHKVSEETDGAFDITVAPLVNIWGFGFKHDAMPSDATIDSLLSFVGYNKVHLVGSRIKKDDPRTMLDCSAIAKGYGVDAVASMLRAHGIKNFLVEIGGEIVACGMNPQQKNWSVGVAVPVDDSLAMNNENAAVLTMTDFAMATSGNYRNFYYKDGKKIAHTIDPRTGRPVQHSLLSATVIAPTCAMADAYATSFMVMGVEKAKAILSKKPKLKAVLIYSDGNKYGIWYSEGLKEKLRK